MSIVSSLNHRWRQIDELPDGTVVVARRIGGSPFAGVVDSAEGYKAVLDTTRGSFMRPCDGQVLVISGWQQPSLLEGRDEADERSDKADGRCHPR